MINEKEVELKKKLKQAKTELVDTREFIAKIYTIAIRTILSIRLLCFILGVGFLYLKIDKSIAWWVGGFLVFSEILRYAAWAFGSQEGFSVRKDEWDAVTFQTKIDVWEDT